MAHNNWWRIFDICASLIGIPLGFALAYWLLIKAQEWVTYYRIEPIVALCVLNVLGLVALYLGFQTRNWASKHQYERERAITTLNAVINPPMSESTIAQTKLPFRKSSHPTPAATQKPPYPSQAPNIMSSPKGNNIQPMSLNKASINISLFLHTLFKKRRDWLGIF